MQQSVAPFTDNQDEPASMSHVQEMRFMHQGVRVASTLVSPELGIYLFVTSWFVSIP